MWKENGQIFTIKMYEYILWIFPIFNKFVCVFFESQLKKRYIFPWAFFLIPFFNAHTVDVNKNYNSHYVRYLNMIFYVYAQAHPVLSMYNLVSPKYKIEWKALKRKWNLNVIIAMHLVLICKLCVNKYRLEWDPRVDHSVSHHWQHADNMLGRYKHTAKLSKPIPSKWPTKLSLWINILRFSVLMKMHIQNKIDISFTDSRKVKSEKNSKSLTVAIPMIQTKAVKKLMQSITRKIWKNPNFFSENMRNKNLQQ